MAERANADCMVFYSWQSDLPNTTNRGFIQTALEKVARDVRRDDSIQVEPVIDRDTAGVPGTPDIAETIFAKIDRAQVFACDVSIVNSGSTRPSPNPNVLLELGFARKALGSHRIIMLMNTVFGGPEVLPFDLRQRRVITYAMAEETKDRAPERKKLEQYLEAALRSIIATLEQPSTDADQLGPLADRARAAIETSQPNQTLLTTHLLNSLWKAIDAIAPEFPGSDQSNTDDALVEAIEAAIPVVLEFARLTDVVAAVGAQEPATAIFASFDHCFRHHNPPVGFSGTFYPVHGDYYRFLGHELFVIFVAHLVKYNRWQLLADVLEERVYVENTRRGSDLVPFHDLSDLVRMLVHRSERLKLNRVSLHADILNERYTQGPLASLVSMDQFIDADFLLFLREGTRWRAWSTIYMNDRTPRFLAESQRAKIAQQHLTTLRIASVDEYRQLIAERVPLLRQLFSSSQWFSPLEDFRLADIGSV